MPPTTKKQLKWDDKIVELLFHCIFQKKAHIAKRSEVSEKWNAVNEMFFAQESMILFKEDHYKPNEPRKLREKFTSKLKSILEDMAKGNQSGKSGDLNALYATVKQISYDIDLIEEEKKAASGLKAKLDETVDMVLKTKETKKPDDGYGKRKLLDGTIIDPKKKPTHKFIAFEEQFMTMMMNKWKTPTNTLLSKEEKVEKDMIKWIDENDKSLDDLLTVSKLKVNDEMFALLEEHISLPTVVNIYCTRDQNFSAKLFKETLSPEGVSQLISIKLYAGLQKWREEATLKAEEAKKLREEDDRTATTISIVTETPSSIYSSSSSAGTPKRKRKFEEVNPPPTSNLSEEIDSDSEASVNSQRSVDF